MAASPTGSARASPLPRVLVVDNDPTMVRVVERILGNAYETHACTDAEDALALIIAGSRFDAILCDLLMPGMGGHDFYRKVLAVDSATAARLVFITGAACVPELRTFLESISNVVLDKPFTSIALRDVVRAAVARHAGLNTWRTFQGTMER